MLKTYAYCYAALIRQGVSEEVADMLALELAHKVTDRTWLDELLRDCVDLYHVEGNAAVSLIKEKLV